MRSRYLFAAPLLAAVAIAGCGGSSNPDTANLQLPPSASQTATFTPTTSSTTSTSTAPTVSTPKSGPLSKQPTVPTPTGPAPTTLVKTDIITGNGALAQTGDTVTVNYIGVLYKTGKTFDSSWGRGTTFTTPLLTTSVIPGWVDGIPGRRVGGRREIIIPPSLGYGTKANGPIPANSTLIFIVDLLAVTPGASTGATGG
jgi:peptidylprolyl isomerase